MPLRASDLARHGWRLRPDLLGERLSAGDYQRPRHVRHLGAQLAKTIAAGNGRLLVTAPPRHSKSETCSHWTPTWIEHLDPRTRVLLASYEATIADEWGRAVRNTLSEHPELDVTVSDDSSAAMRWRTSEGGGMWTAGVGGPLTGRGGELLIIDDPFRNLADAMSAVKRDACWNWYKAVARTRLHPGGTIIVITTRWHTEDLAGHLLEQGDFDHLRFPALAEPDEADRQLIDAGVLDLDDWRDPIGRAYGEPLWPERFDLEALEALRSDVGEMWAGLYQQRPTDLQGELFARQKWNYADVPPADLTALVRRFDLAATKEGGDWTAAVLEARDGQGRTYILDVRRVQADPADVEAFCRSVCEDDRNLYRGRVRVRVEQEPGASGVALRDRYVRQVLAGFPVTFAPSSGDKVIRALPFAAQVGAGNVTLCKVAHPMLPIPEDRPIWMTEFVEEHAAFPRGGNDDMVDAASLAFNDLVAHAPQRARAKSMSDRQVLGLLR